MSLWRPEGVTRYCMPEHHESLFIHPVTPSLQGSVLSSNTFKKTFTLRKEFIFSLVVCWWNYIYLHQFPLTNSSSASSNWFWCATARIESLLIKDLAEFFEHHQHNLGFYFFILFLKGDSLQLSNRLQWLHKTNYPGCKTAESGGENQPSSRALQFSQPKGPFSPPDSAVHKP